MGEIKRKKFLQNNNWKFVHGDYPEAKETSYDDSTWYDIGLPHSFGIPYFMENEFYVGYGCYRKKLYIEKEWIGKKVSLEFQGAFQDAEIYVNGLLAGVHKGGYTAFEIDITPYITFGDNQLFVRLNNLWNPRLAPRAGEHVFNGGIYRDVSLIITEPLHITWYGTSVTTPVVSKDKAEVSIETEIKNEFNKTVDCKLKSVALYKGEIITSSTTTRQLAPGQVYQFEQTEIVNNPKLWSPEIPKLYTLKSFVYVGEELYDSYETTFGIRFFKFTADKGFFLNGEHYDILGANVHQDHAGWGDAVTHSGIQRDISMIKGCGMNFIRGSHYPHHTYFAEECDKQGILFWSENCFWGTGGPNLEGYWTSSGYPINEEDQQEFEESCINTLKEMIRTNRNHPSIIVWSMCNEPFFTNAEVTTKAKALIRRLVQVTHEVDPTRPAAVGGAQRGGFDALGDLAGYNGDGAAIYMNPGFPNFVSEYGSTVAYRPGEFIPSFTDGTEKNFAWRSGKSLWCAFHHGSILNMGNMGMIDYYRLPLNSWYWYRENLLGIKAPEPLKEGLPYGLKLTADRSIISTDGTEDAHIIVNVVDESGKDISNSMEVVLEIVSGPAIFPTGKTIKLSPEKNNLLVGKGAIEVRSYFSGESKIIAKAEGLQQGEFVINAVGGDKWNNQHINELLPPPSIMKPPYADKSFSIGKHRPVFASSFDPNYPSRNITDDNYETCWRAEKEQPGEWIMIDLEGSKAVSRADIIFEDMSSQPLEIGISDDRKTFNTVLHLNDGSINSFLSVSLSGKKVRYLRVKFIEKPIGIRSIDLFT